MSYPAEFLTDANGNHHVHDASCPTKSTLLFSIENKVGALDQVLKTLAELKINLTRIESRPSKTAEWDYDFFVDFNVTSAAQNDEVVSHLKKVANQVHVISSVPAKQDNNQVPWFPRKLTDLDSFADKVLGYGAELDADHPGFKDAAYRQRREDITKLAKTFRTGMSIPKVDYTKEEIETWRIVFRKLVALYPTHACREHRYVFPLLQANCGYKEDNIPQLQDVSNFLKECTGWTLRPVMGLLDGRDFLNGLAFRVFHSTQYIRHHSQPFYTPEPDVCHELLGHVPLFADPEFADFSQEIGLASLGATDEELEQLLTIYWFMVEFGLCKEDGKVKAFGAGLLSSYGELEYCLTDKPKLLPFDAKIASVTKYPITEYQPLYFVAESFASAKEKVREFASNMKRPFSVRYNPYSETIEVLDTKEKILRYGQSIKSSMQTLLTALDKLPSS